MLMCSERIVPRGGLAMRPCSRWGWYLTPEGLKCKQHLQMWERRQEPQP
jgi:hypothetical protein